MFSPQSWQLLLGGCLLAGFASGAERRSPPLSAIRVTAEWHGPELGAVLNRVALAANRLLLIDRRVDRSQRIELEVKDRPVHALLGQLLGPTQLGYCELERLLYVGPPDTAQELRTLCAESRSRAAKAPLKIRRGLSSSIIVRWPRLAEPREVIEQICQQRGVPLSNPEAIPHDLWPAGELPRTPLAEQLTLLLVGFDLDWQVTPSGDAMTIVERSPGPWPVRAKGPF